MTLEDQIEELQRELEHMKSEHFKSGCDETQRNNKALKASLGALVKAGEAYRASMVTWSVMGALLAKEDLPARAVWEAFEKALVNARVLVL